MNDDKKEITCSDFERKIGELQKVVDGLESDVSLEESMRLFESGIELTKDCIDELNRTQSRIDELKDRLDIILRRGSGDENE